MNLSLPDLLKNPFAVAVGLILMCQGLIATAQGIALVGFISPPLIVEKSEALTPVVKVGGVVIVENTYVRKAYCKAEVDRFVLRKADKRLMSRVRLNAGASLLGTEKVMIPINTKKGNLNDPGGSNESIPPGMYVLRSFLHSDCGDKLHTVNIPDVEFEIVE